MGNLDATIFSERLDMAMGILNDSCKKYNLQLKDFEKLDIATRIAASLFIQKNKSFNK